MVAYITVDQLKQYVRSEQGAAGDSMLEQIIEAASQAINDHCQRDFTAVAADAEASARLFIPSESPLQAIYDCTEITAVSESGTALASTYWQAEPVNGLDGSGRSRPFDTIRRLSGNWCQTSSYTGKASLSVTAKWGWAATPSTVIAACRIVATRISDERNTRGGLVDFGDFAAAARRHVSGMGDLLDPLRSIRSWGIA